MELEFTKMHGAGNDFILFCPHDPFFPEKRCLVSLCSRNRGIGADGLIIISRTNEDSSFSMKYYNSDGSEAGMCGNGLRCAALFCSRVLGAPDKMSFCTGAGELSAEIAEDKQIRISIPVISPPEKALIDGKTYFFCNTGVPHLVAETPNLSNLDILTEGRRLRYHERFQPEGTNVDFIDPDVPEGAPVPLRTYERGVENETPACGTGAAAAALCLKYIRKKPSPIRLITPEKDILQIDFTDSDVTLYGAAELKLTGPAEIVFSGKITIERNSDET